MWPTERARQMLQPRNKVKALKVADFKDLEPTTLENACAAIQRVVLTLLAQPRPPPPQNKAYYACRLHC